MAMQQKQVKKQQRRRMGTAMAAMTSPMYAARVGWHDGGNCEVKLVKQDSRVI